MIVVRRKCFGRLQSEIKVSIMLENFVLVQNLWQLDRSATSCLQKLHIFLYNKLVSEV